MTKRNHKFALLDVCQRMEADHFKQFCIEMGLDRESAERIIRQEPLPEEQYYNALKELVQGSSNPLTFNDVKDGLLSCSRMDLVTLVINRIKCTTS